MEINKKMNVFQLSGKVTFKKPIASTSSYVFGLAVERDLSQSPTYLSVFIKQDAKGVNFEDSEVGSHMRCRGYISASNKDGVTQLYLNAYEAYFMSPVNAQDASAVKPKTANAPQTARPQSKWSQNKSKPAEEETDEEIEAFFTKDDDE
jgi:hypothetical protein